MEAFLVYCLLEESPPFDAASFDESQLNQTLTAKRGREPGLMLQRDGKPVSLHDWASEIVCKVSAVAELVDRCEGDGSYKDAVMLMTGLVEEPDRTPSARLLQELREADCSFFEFALKVARGHKDYFQSIARMPEERARELEGEARQSVQRQHDIEAADSIDFEEYLARYFASD